MRILLVLLLVTGCASAPESDGPRLRIQMGTPEQFGFPPTDSIEASKAEILKQWGDPRSVFYQPRGRRDTEVWVYHTDDPKWRNHIYFPPGSKANDNGHPLDSTPHILPATPTE